MGRLALLDKPAMVDPDTLVCGVGVHRLFHQLEFYMSKRMKERYMNKSSTTEHRAEPVDSPKQLQSLRTIIPFALFARFIVPLALPYTGQKFRTLMPRAEIAKVSLDLAQRVG